MSQYVDSATINMLIDLTKIVLQHNLFEFDNKLFLQLLGFAMGSKMAPSMANIYMWWFEKKFLPNAPIKPLHWYRYIDDIFSIFVCSDEDLACFQKWINQVHPTIKLTMEQNVQGIPFLDTMVKIENDHLTTKPYTKPTDRKQYLLPSSCHPSHIIRSIPYSQCLRISRICTHDHDFEREVSNLKGYFLKRDYEESSVNDAIQRVTKARFSPLITHSTSNRPLHASAMVIPFHHSNPPFQKCINEIWSHQNPIIDKIGKPLVAFNRPRNLKDILVRSRFGPPTLPIPAEQHRPINRPITTYDKMQFKAPIQHVLFTCPHHELLQDEFNNLEEATNSLAYTNFNLAHSHCGKCNLIPVQATHQVSIKCNECRFRANISTTKRKKDIECQLLNTCTCTRDALLRHPPTHDQCGCNICKLVWQVESVRDHKGTTYRLLPFNCNKGNVIYIIHCSLCNSNYVGLTTNPIKQRMFNHLHNIKNWKNTSVAQHFMTAGHNIEDHFKVAIIDSSKVLIDLKLREGVWMHVLNTVSDGINLRDEMRRNMDYQSIIYAQHFKHSRTCLPYFTHRIQQITTLDLKPYKRNPLKPHINVNRKNGKTATGSKRGTMHTHAPRTSLFTFGFTSTAS